MRTTLTQASTSIRAITDIRGDFRFEMSLEGKDLVEGRVQKYSVEMSVPAEMMKHLWLTSAWGETGSAG